MIYLVVEIVETACCFWQCSIDKREKKGMQVNHLKNTFLVKNASQYRSVLYTHFFQAQVILLRTINRMLRQRGAVCLTYSRNILDYRFDIFNDSEENIF